MSQTMEEAPLQDPGEIKWVQPGRVGVVSYGDPMNCQFYRASMPNGSLAVAGGGPTHVSCDMVRIWAPGEFRLQVHVTTVDESHKARWPQQWAAYETGRAQIPDGTPLLLLYPQEPDIIDRMRIIGVHTVQQLAELSELGVQRLGHGARTFVAKAKAFVDLNKDAGKITALMAQMDEMRAQMDAMRQVSAFAASQQGGPLSVQSN